MDLDIKTLDYPSLFDWHSDKLFGRSDAFIACVLPQNSTRSRGRTLLQASERTARHSARCDRHSDKLSAYPTPSSLALQVGASSLLGSSWAWAAVADTTLEPVRIKGGQVLMAVVTLLGCLLVACSAGFPSDGNSAAPTTTAAAPEPSIPPDGITLAALGYLNGPIQQFSLPRTAVITAKVDQPNNVTAVVSSPSPKELRSYFLRALPAAGFEITADRPETNTMTFVGHGWSGSFTGDDRASAVLLRPR